MKYYELAYAKTPIAKGKNNTMKCNNCGNEVSKGFDDLLYPVCGQRIVFEKLFDLISYVVEHKGISIVSKHKVFISLLRDYAPNLNKEIRLIQIAVESGTYDELIAVDGTSDFQKTIQIKKSVDVLKTSYYLDEKQAVRAVKIIVDCMGWSQSLLNNAFPAKTSKHTVGDVSKAKESVASVSAVKYEPAKNENSKYLPKSFNPKIIPIVLFAIMEIVGVIYVLSTNIIQFALGQSAGSYAALQFVLVIHVLVGCILCRCAKIKGLSYVSSIISVVIAGYSFIYAMTNLTGGVGLEGAFI